ncbi:unnamed protein product [Arabis nemorensis]|uniref:Uncharacterized protein n=1 Tax=Arabis nemorensis TaxID=586526 RepID=A0A565CCQ1_9BRAS|nr:unnamed protein product [Arabis nemorensis]
MTTERNKLQHSLHEGVNFEKQSGRGRVKCMSKWKSSKSRVSKEQEFFPYMSRRGHHPNELRASPNGVTLK